MNATAIQLPLEADAGRVFKALSVGFNALESVVYPLERMAKYDGTDLEAPHISLEHLAAITILGRDLHVHILELQTMEKELESASYAAVAIRDEQQARSGPESRKA